MQFIKVIVVVMALLIVAGVGVLGWGLTHRWNRLGAASEPAAMAAAPVAAPVSGADAGYAAIDVPAPPGTSFAQMETAGDRVLLRFTGAAGEKIVVIDPRTGRITANISISPAAP